MSGADFAPSAVALLDQLKLMQTPREEDSADACDA
jgi:hypothetical protein